MAEREVSARSALELALEALENYDGQTWEQTKEAITAIKEALAQPAVTEGHEQSTPWRVLTDEETDHIIRQPHGGADPQEWVKNLASALEAKLKAKNERKEKNT